MNSKHCDSKKSNILCINPPTRLISLSVHYIFIWAFSARPYSHHVANVSQVYTETTINEFSKAIAGVQHLHYLKWGLTRISSAFFCLVLK